MTTAHALLFAAAAVVAAGVLIAICDFLDRNGQKRASACYIPIHRSGESQGLAMSLSSRHGVPE
jgi:hypothetical protein